MGSRRTETRETETEDEKNSSREFSADDSSTTTLNGAGVPITETRDIDRAESHYGIEIPDRRTLQQLQIAEDVHGSRVHEWVAEGMPTDILGKTRDMAAFRDRQAERPPEVPTDIERRNNRSVHRSTEAARETRSAGETSVPESVRDVIASSGQSLDADIQRAMESRMGDSFGDVQIHTGPQAANACEEINARAFTVGNNIAFNRGEYDPSSPEGQHVLAHELAHVRQQTGGAVSMLPQESFELEIDPDPELEREAEETAQRVMAGGELGIQRLSDTAVHVQRSLGSDEKSATYSPESQPSTDGMDAQALIEQIIEGAKEIDWVTVLKKAVIAAAEKNPITGALLAAGDEIDGQLRDDSVSEGNLIPQLKQEDGYDDWVGGIAQQAADIVQNEATGSNKDPTGVRA